MTSLHTSLHYFVTFDPQSAWCKFRGGRRENDEDEASSEIKQIKFKFNLKEIKFKDSNVFYQNYDFISGIKPVTKNKQVQLNESDR